MTNHVILPAAMVKPLLLHMFHKPTIDADVKLWVYGGKDDGEALRNYHNYHKSIMMIDATYPLITIGQCEYIEETAARGSHSGFSTLEDRAKELVDKNFKSAIMKIDRVNIIADTEYWLAVAAMFKSCDIIDSAPRVIANIKTDSAEARENLKYLFGIYNGAIRIDLIDATSKNCDLLCAARTVEAMEPPEESNGIYLTKEKSFQLYATECHLPTPVTGTSISFIKQLGRTLADAAREEKFLKLTRTQGIYSTSETVKCLQKSLEYFDKYLHGLQARFKSTYQTESYSRQMSRVDEAAPGLGVNTYVKLALKILISMCINNIKNVDLGTDAEEYEIDEEQERVPNLELCIDPNLGYRLMDRAFSGAGGEQAARLRSACMDVWEALYRCDDRELQIAEYLIEEPDQAQYKIERPGEWTAITTNSTGFAVNSLQEREIKELRERDKDFKCFLYGYVMIVGGFSEGFKNYVSRNCGSNEVYNPEGFHAKYPEIIEFLTNQQS